MMTSLYNCITRKKVVDVNTLTSTQLNRCLSIFDLTALGVGSTLGVGIYVLAGEVAPDTGPSIIISFLIAGLASVLSGLCYAEFGARVPKAGSAYVYSYVTIGELCAFVIGWNLILEYIIGAASVARGWSSYFDSLFDDKIKNFTITNIGEMHAAGIAKYPDLLAVLIIAVLTIVMVYGIRKTSWLMSLVTCINIFVILFVVGVGACYAEPKNWSDNFMPFGFSGVMSGAATCFYAFVGFDIIATTGEEARNPSRGIPISIVLSLGICTLAYFGVSAILTLMWPYSTLPDGGTLPKIFALKGAPWAQYVIAVGALCGLTSSLLGCLLPLPRMLYSMGSDGIIFKFLAKVNPKTGTPVIASVGSGIFSALLAFIFNLRDLVDMMSLGTLMAYTIVAVCVLVLRYRPENVGFVKENYSDAIERRQTDDQETPEEDSPLLEVRKAKRPSKTTAFTAQVAIVSSCIGLAALSALVICGSDALSQAKWWAILLLSLISMFLIGCIVLLFLLPQNKTPLPFTVPFVPVLPLVSVFINVFLMLELSYLTWIRFVVWMAIGFSIYFFYGIRNSLEGERQICQFTDENQMS
ncbi:cationic amino acid transporter 2-like [Montipora capricornis]|uniref:cationic amino acid transporter 2-like n=1 Tax=Montipora capricornis TaxID=246305 RepID=UPI0035F105A7